MTQLAITAALVVVIMLLVVIPLAALMIRRRKPELERARTAPFPYGVAPAPSPACTSFRHFPVAGQPATLSVYDPGARTPAAAGAPGRLLLEVPVGPQWPMVVTTPRSTLQGIGLLLAKQQKIAGTSLSTGDPEFDAAFWSGYLDATPDEARRVLNPQVRAALMAGDVQRLYAVHKLGISATMRPGSDVNARIGDLVQLAELVVCTAGIPLHQGPPATYGPGAPWAPQ